MFRTYGLRRRKLSPEETAANKAKRDERKQAARHCQCCGRAILANKGTIAAHGYQRPGWGYQTDSCMGAGYLPFEVSRDRLAKLLDVMKKHRSDLQTARDEVAAEKRPAAISYTERNPKYAGERIPRVIHVTRETFEALRSQHEATFRMLSLYDFDKARDADVRHIEYQLTQLDRDIREQQARFDGWKQTERREGGQWVAV